MSCMVVRYIRLVVSSSVVFSLFLSLLLFRLTFTLLAATTAVLLEEGLERIDVDRALILPAAIAGLLLPFALLLFIMLLAFFALCIISKVLSTKWNRPDAPSSPSRPRQVH